MLNVVTKDEAVEIVKSKVSQIVNDTEKVNIDSALFRVLAEDIISEEDIPAFDRSTMDGYALRAVCAADTFGAGNTIPAQLEIVGEIKMGEAADFTLRRGQCAKISTGGMLPDGADAAVMVEHTDNADGLCLVYKSVSPSENVTKRGDDISKSDVALKRGTMINSSALGVLAALGIYEVPVYKKPVIAVISTGDEIVSGSPELGQIRDINTFLLTAAAREHGCEVIKYGAVKDDKNEIENAVKACAQSADCVLISGGSSAGTRDMTVDIIDSLGEVFFHGIAMKPGKPSIFGTVNKKPVFGLPGHPLAAYFVFRLIVTEYIKTVLNMPADKPKKSGVLAVNIPSNHGREEYLCMKQIDNNGVVPVHTKSGIISVLSEAEGFIKIPRNAEGLAKGTSVEIFEL